MVQVQVPSIACHQRTLLLCQLLSSVFDQVPNGSPCFRSEAAWPIFVLLSNSW
jgi:hypothetical protein